MGREILNKRQNDFLEAVKNDPDIGSAFYFSGGTALAAFYLNHRESEDLDFFSEEEIEPLVVEVFLKSNQPRLGFEHFEFQKSFNRNLFFLHFTEGILKTEFTYFPFASLQKGTTDGRLHIDSLRDIAVNKTFTVSQQTRARDFIDLFYIIEKTKWTLRELLKDARVKFDTHIDLIQLGAQLLKVGELKDLPRMRIPFDADKLVSFFNQEAASFKADVLE